MEPGRILETLEAFARYPVPLNVAAGIRDHAARFGRLELRRLGEGLVLTADEESLAEELARTKGLALVLAARLPPRSFRIAASERGRLKQLLIKLGWPVRDLAGFVSGERLPLSLRATTSRPCTSARRKVGRILERHVRAAKRFDIEVKLDPSRASEVRLTWKERKDWRVWTALTEGTYILRTNVNDWSDEELWKTYVQLWQAEAAFRITKSDLSIRPIWHQREERVLGHILVCFLAFCMWKALEGWQSQAGLGNSPRTLFAELKRVQCVDVVLPVVDGPKLRLCCVAQPDAALASLIERLGLRLPRRLRRQLPSPECAEKLEA